MKVKMFRLLMSFIIVVMAGLILRLGLTAMMASPALAQGGTSRYVAPPPSGSDSGNDCTNGSTPCATVQHAIDVAQSGDLILVTEGLFTGSIVVTKTVTLQGLAESFSARRSFC